MKDEIKLANHGKDELIFVTGNPSKLAEAQKVAEKYGVNLEAKALEIDEIQSNEPMKVALAKAKSAYEILKRPVVVHDSSWAIPALNGFPGAYMHDVVRWFGVEDWLNLARGHADRTVRIYENVAYYDGEVEKCFQHYQEGVLADEPRGIDGNSIEKVAIFADGKTIAEHHDANGVTNNSVGLRAWEEFFEWYSGLGC